MTESIPPTPEEVRQLRRSVWNKVLDTAANEPAWKQLFLDDPEAATAEFAEAQRLREMYESVPPAEASPEAMPTPQEEYRQLQRSLWEKMLDRAASDPAWKQWLLDDPEAVMSPANFPEIEKLEEMRQSAETSREAEAVGHVMTDPYQYTSRQQGFCCAFYTLGQTKY
jgi:hypothetical protein